MNVDFLQNIVNQVREKEEAYEMSPRDILNAFGFSRRSKYNCKTIDDFLTKNEVVAEPHYTSVWVDAMIRLVPKAKAKRRNAEDPVKRLLLIQAANKTPCYIDNSEPIDKAITLLMLHHYSHLPVTNKGLRGIVGYVSWKTIGEARANGVESKQVKDYVDKRCDVLTLDTPLLTAIDHVYKNGFILVKNGAEELCGIVTTKDISTQFLIWTKPYLMLEEIENQVRTLMDGKFLLEDLKKYCKEEEREVGI